MSRLPDSLRQTGVIFLLTRGALMLLAPLAYWITLKVIPEALDVSAPWHFNPVQNFSGWAHYVIEPWARWDTEWYVRIAQNGYRAEDNSTAFFPLYPMLMAMLRPFFWGNAALAGIFISLASCLAAFCWLYRLVEIDFDRATARKSVLYLAVFPTSFFFQTIYTESLFLALTIGCFFAARRRNYILAGIAGGLAALTRSAGVLLLAPLIIFYLQDCGWNWRRIRFNGFHLLFVPLGLGLWMAYQKIHFGDALMFASAQSHWERQFISPLHGGPLTALLWGLIWAWRGLGDIITGPVTSFWPLDAADPGMLGSYAFLDFSFSISFFILSIIAFWRLPFAYAAYSLLIISLPLFFPHVPTGDFALANAVPLYSMQRFVLEAFPVFILLAIWGSHKRWINLLILIPSVLLLFLLTTRFVIGEWVA